MEKLNKRTKLKKMLFSAMGHAFICGATTAFGLELLIVAIEGSSWGSGIFAVLLFGITIFSTIRGEKIYKIIRKEIDVLTELPLETAERLRKEKEEDV